MNKPELLAPAGNLEKFKLACIYGADAVFLGGQEFGLRSNADNFSIEEIQTAVEFGKAYNVDVYVTTNIYAHDENIEGFASFAKDLERVGVKGVIISDPSYIEIINDLNLNLEIHISTQQSITNSFAANFYKRLNATRVVLARELSFEEIEEVKNNTDLEIEVFIHGAVCSSYSGRCTLSNYFTSRDSNRGGCVQSCRWDYKLLTKDSEDNYVEVLNETDFSMSAKDMQLLNHIPRLCEIGVDSFKIEGRMKSHHYVATVIKVYREAIDTYFEDPENYYVKEEWINELLKAEARISYEGALISDMSEKDQIFNEQYKKNQDYIYCGSVLSYDKENKTAFIEQRNLFEVGDKLEFFGPNKANFIQKVDIIINENGEQISRANHPLMKVYVKTDIEVGENWMIRKIN